MRTRRRIGPIFAVLAALAGASPANAQTIHVDKETKANPSHIEVPFHPSATGQFADFLKSRDHAREASEAFQRLKDLFDQLAPDEQKELFPELLDENGRRRPLEQLKKEDVLPLLERIRGQFEDKAGNDGDANVPLLDGLEAVKEWVKQLPNGASVKPRIDLPPPPADRPPEPIPSSARRERTNAPGQPIQQSSPPETSPEEKREALKKNLADWWDRVKGGPLGNSETLRELGRKFSQPFTGGGGRSTDTEGLLEKLPRLGDYIPFKGMFSRGLPSIPKPDWSSTMPSVGNAGAFGAPDSGALMGILWIGMAVATVAVIWRLLAARPATRATDAGPAWRLGPWPVDPAKIATRQDLVRAFEYLSLLMLGPTARSWNHRAIAARLSAEPNDAGADRRLAAEHLAGLYEKARYAPPADPLPDGEVRDARRDLCFLAGVAHA